ncbi:hypothetical protein Tcan_02723 [Toxocara canis]|uniref:Uncharacterized protein n=1 Tax=Toxocara canis TaxID=6265 RepID=A0A0B2UZ09_TOXCA|nr:hypothetical protein Tcan_02723 [Toxocara canis]
MVCFIGITFLILLFVQFSIQSLDERFDEDWMQSPVIKSYERHLNKISLRLNGRPAVVRGRVKRYRCIEEYIPSVDDLQESAFDPTFIQNEDASALRRHMLKGKVSRKSITRETVGLQEKRYSNSFDRQASRAITATNNVYMGDSLERKMENPSRGFFTDVLNEETVKDIRKWDVPKAVIHLTVQRKMHFRIKTKTEKMFT